MTSQETYRKRYKTLNPKWLESTEIYREMVEDVVDKNSKILDIGCGHSNLLEKAYTKAHSAYGIDPENDAVDRNPYIKEIRTEYVENLSFEDNFFDVVVSAWVFEHLPDPQKALSEIHRVLKPGGVAIFLTPNILNYNVWIIRLIPERFHDYLTKKLYGRQENDTFPKKYKINSIKRIRKLFKDSNFKEEEIITNGDPSYISFNNFTFKIAILLEKILNMNIFKKFRVHIIGKFSKEK